MAQIIEHEKLNHTVHQTEQDDLDRATQAEKKRRFWEKLSLYNIGVLIIGSVAIGLALAILIFIWYGASTVRRSGYAPSLWRTIVVRGWTTRAVTVSSVILRVATATQLGMFTAIIAALILERVGASTADLPHLSMLRCSNTGPLSLFWNLWNSLGVGSQFGYSVLVVLAILNSFALQFTSTILLADFAPVSVVSQTLPNNFTFGLGHSVRKGDTNAYQGVDYWTTSPTTYARFAEYSEAGSQTATYIDTGKTYRGFVPLRTSDERATLREFTGPVTVVDARVVCVKPTLSNIIVTYGSEDFIPTINATLTFNNTHPSLQPSPDAPVVRFNCSLPVHVGLSLQPLDYWAASLCSFGRDTAEFTEGLRTDWEAANARSTSTSLIFNMTGNGSDLSDAMGDEYTASFAPTESTGSPWSSYSRGQVRIDVTMCVINPTPQDYRIKIWTPKDDAETTLGWNTNDGSYETTSIRRLFGANSKPAPLDDRGLYHLEQPSNWTAAQVNDVYNVSVENFVWDAQVVSVAYYETFIGIFDTYMLTPYAYKGAIHRSHWNIVQQILKDTRNPALAVQTLYTIMMQMAYYDFLPEFDTRAEGTYRSSTAYSIPHQWTAFAAIAGLLGLHFILVAVAVTLFLTKTKMSLLGNAWQAVMQVHSDETAGVVRHGSGLTDKEMEDMLKSQGAAENRVRITKSARGRVESAHVQRRSGRDGSSAEA